MAPDLMQFAQELMQQQKAAAATNTWDPFISALDPIQSILVKNAASGNAKLGELAFGSLLTGILGGGLNILKDKEQAQTNQQISEIMQSAALGKPVEKPSGMSDTLYQNAVTKGQTYAAQKALERQNELQKLSDQFSLFKQQELFKDPYLAKRINSVLGQGSGGSVFSGGEVTKEPSSTKPFQSYLDQTDGDKAAAEKLFEKDLNKNKEDTARVDALRKEFLGLSAVKNYDTLATQYNILKEAAKDTSGTSDLDFIYGVAKMLDPNAVVRESDAGAVIDSGGMAPGLKNRLEKFLTGSSGIRTDTRDSLLKLAERHLLAQKSATDALAESYRDIAKSQGLDSSQIVILPGTSVQDLIKAEAMAQGIDPELALNLAKRESNFNQSAVGSKGERGLFQIMPDTAKELGIDPGDMNQNIKGGLSYLKKLSEKYGGDLEKALAAYNAGPGRVDSGTIPDSTKSYVSDILGKKEAPQMDEALMAQLMQFKTFLDQNGLVFQNGQFFKRK